MEIRFGILGCGAIAAHHAQAIAMVPGAVLAGAADARPESARTFCEKYGGQAFESMEAMLASPAVDAVCVLTPSGLHAQHAIQAADAGKHVLVEKPVALNLLDADRIIAAGERNHVCIGVVSQYRFADSILRLKGAVDQGLLGRIVTADVSMKYYRSPEYFASSSWRGTWAMDGGGALMNQGIHGVDTLLYIAGAAKSVYGLARTLRHSIEVEDTALAAVEFESGALGYVQGTTSVYPGFPRRLSVSGTKGTITVCEQLITEWEIEGRPRDADLALGGNQRTGASDPLNFDTEGHARHIQDMVEAIATGRPPAVSVREARRCIQLITAIYESSRTGRRVDMKDWG